MLPDHIKELALLRQAEQGYARDENKPLNTYNFEGVFNWNKTPEDMQFWEMINIGEFDVFHEMYPDGIQHLLPESGITDKTFCDMYNTFTGESGIFSGIDNPKQLTVNFTGPTLKKWTEFAVKYLRNK